MRLAADARMEAMKPSLEFLPDDRVLVLAPHPDDEVLATGGLIQQALAAGAALRVIVATTIPGRSVGWRNAGGLMRRRANAGVDGDVQKAWRPSLVLAWRIPMCASSVGRTRD